MTAKQLKDWRERAGFTRAELAARLGTSHRNVESWEQDRRAIPPLAQKALEDLMRQDILKIPVSPELREKLNKLAKERGVDPALWAQEILSKILPMMLAAFIVGHAIRSGSNWSASSLASTGKAAIGFISNLIP